MRFVWLMILNLMVVLAATTMPGHAAVVDVVVQPRQEIADTQFDSWLFQTARNEAGCRKRLEAQMNVLLFEATRDFALSESQQQKLRLAARGDVKRFFDQVEIRRDKFQELKHDRQNMSKVFQELQPLQQRLNAGLFEKDSLFAKVLQYVLDDAQQEIQIERQADRIERQRKAAVRIAIVELERILPLNHRQRLVLTEQLLGTANSIPVMTRYGKYLMHYHLSEIDQAKLIDVLDEAQMEGFKKYAEQGKAYAAFLRQQGLLASGDRNE